MMSLLELSRIDRAIEIEAPPSASGAPSPIPPSFRPGSR